MRKKYQNSKIHIRHILLYEWQSGRSKAMAARNICQAIGPNATTKKTAGDWFRRFDQGDFSLEEKPKSGRPTEIDFATLKQLIEEDPTLTTYNVASEIRCSQKSVSYHFSKLGLVSKLGDQEPHRLDARQKKIVLTLVQICSSCTAHSLGWTT